MVGFNHHLTASSYSTFIFMANPAENNTLVPMLIVICGATATGKSRLAIALAKRLNSVILSADSRQVYREFNIGTAKPAIAEQENIPHYLIDICEPTETLTLAEYQMQAQQLIENIHRGRGNREQRTGSDTDCAAAGRWNGALHPLNYKRTQNSQGSAPTRPAIATPNLGTTPVLRHAATG